MRRKLALTGLAVALSATAMVPDAAMARHRTYHQVSHRCSGGSGTVGTIAGGAGGAVLGHAVVGGPVATIAGGVGGAVLGRHIDRHSKRHRAGC